MTNSLENRSYKTRRAFLNAKIHALAIRIAGKENERALLQVESEALCSETFNGVSKLSDSQAESLYNTLLKVNSKIGKSLADVSPASGEPSPKASGNSGTSMTVKQRRNIITLSRDSFKWDIPRLFAYILETCPPLRSRLSGWELEYSRITKLFSIMSNKDADKVIKRMTGNEKNLIKKGASK